MPDGFDGAGGFAGGLVEAGAGAGVGDAGAGVRVTGAGVVRGGIDETGGGAGVGDSGTLAGGGAAGMLLGALTGANAKLPMMAKSMNTPVNPTVSQVKKSPVFVPKAEWPPTPPKAPDRPLPRFFCSRISPISSRETSMKTNDKPTVQNDARIMVRLSRFPAAQCRAFARMQAVMIAAKSAATRLAPPTKAPSTSGHFINSNALSGFTLPPY